MKYRDIILLIKSAALLSSAVLASNSTPALQQFVPPVPKPGETCVLVQTCKGRGWLNPMSTYPCTSSGQPPQATDILNPVISYFKPVPIMKEP